MSEAGAQQTPAKPLAGIVAAVAGRHGLLLVIAAIGLAGGIAATLLGYPGAADIVWAAGTVPVAAALAVSMVADLLAGRFGVDALALVSMTAALLLGEPLAGAVIALMYSGGNVLEDVAVTRAESALRSLIDRAPRAAHRRQGDSIADVAIDAVAVGDRLVVRPGEVVPVDGLVVLGTALIDQSALTGEPIPVLHGIGEPALSGTVNAGEAFELEATAPAGESTYAGIIRLATAAHASKAPFVRVADRYALLFLPVTLVVSGAAWLVFGDVTRALAVVVAATPCPLILAAPVAFIAGVARAARQGILVKGAAPLEGLALARTVLLDKTGTVTVGGARLLSVEAAPGAEPMEVLRLAASLEQASQHVLAAAMVAAARERGLALSLPSGVSEMPGTGLRGMVDGRRVEAGALALSAGHGAGAWLARALRRASWRSALAIEVTVDGAPAGVILLADELRREAPRAVRMLRAAGIARIVLLTGDRSAAAQPIGAALDLDSVLADRVPADKVDAVRVEQRRAPTIMVGDGINDAPALAAADVGVAMGARGASASSEAADVVIVADRLDRVAEAVSIARRSRGIALQSIVVGMGLSGVAMALGFFGLLAPVPAALSQEAIDVAVILNALRALWPQRGRRTQALAPERAGALAREHGILDRRLDALRAIADALDDAAPAMAAEMVARANGIVQDDLVRHEQADERSLYPELSEAFVDGNALTAMSRAHREIMHLARLLGRLVADLPADEYDRYAIRDAQRLIETIEALARIHNAQENDIYESSLAA